MAVPPQHALLHENIQGFPHKLTQPQTSAQCYTESCNVLTGDNVPDCCDRGIPAGDETVVRQFFVTQKDEDMRLEVKPRFSCIQTSL